MIEEINVVTWDGLRSHYPETITRPFATEIALKIRSGKSLGITSFGSLFVEATRILPEQHIAKDTPQLFGDWIIHKEGFRAPKLLELARLQAWTLKPALRKEQP